MYKIGYVKSAGFCKLPDYLTLPNDYKYFPTEKKKRKSKRVKK